MGKTHYRAEEFFSGRQLEIARAIEANDMTQMHTLVPDVDLAASGQKNMTLLWFAMLRRNYEAVKTLVTLGVNPDTQIMQGIGSALTYTMMPRKDHSDQTGIRLLQAMLDGGLSPNYKTPGGDPLVQRAAGPWGTPAAVQLLGKRAV
jgi:hypothetical protein